MAKTKISEFSATPANNTDIDSINLAEGCAPSGINDAIRELMAQLKDFQTGVAGDSFNGPVGTTTAAAGAFTNLTASGTLGVTGVATLATGSILNTPASVNLTNATALPVTTGIAGMGSGVSTFLAIPSSANLAAAITDETGTGALVFANSPTLVTPALGTPASGVVTNLTGTASININGTVGAATATTGAFTTLAASGAVTLSGGTANGVTYLNGSKVLTSGSALTFDGSTVRASGVMELGGTNLLYMSGKTGDHAYLVLGASNTAQDFLIGSDTNIPLIFRTNATEQMRLTSTGLGIKTSSIIQPLTIGGSGNIYAASGATWYTGGALYIRAGASANLYLGANDNNSLATLDVSGNLGLGVTPSAWGTYKALQVGSGASVWAGGSGNAYFGSNYYFDGSNRRYINTAEAGQYAITNGGHAWSTAPSGTAGNVISFTQAMTLTAGGLLLVGATSAGAVGMTNYPSGITLWNNNNEASGWTFAGFYRGGVGVGSITQTGTTGVLYNVTSDYRLKTVIGPVANAGQRIDALQPVEYEWKADGSRTRGFLAHQFQEVYAGSVTGSKDAVDDEGKPVYQAMQAGSSEVIADLVAEIQSLRQRLAAACIA